MKTCLHISAWKLTKWFCFWTALCPLISKSVSGADNISTHDQPKQIPLDATKGLGDWNIAGAVSIDPHGRTDGKEALKVGPGGSAILKLRDADASGKVEMWVYDDGITPSNFKTNRVGPRWGLMQSNGRVLTAGILYAPYLGGNEGYTASACDGKAWFDQLFWLGVNRAPARWHKWTIELDADANVQILHDDKPVNAIDSAKAGLKGFNSIAIWGDEGKENPQTIRVSEISISLGGPARPLARAEVDPYDPAYGRDPDNRPTPAVEIDNGHFQFAPKASIRPSISQSGITWTFDRQYIVGQFVNGDWYVVGPAIVTSIDPKPQYGSEIPNNQLDHMDKEKPEPQRVRNGFMLNPPAAMKVAYDSGVRNYFDPSLVQKLPVTMKPGDSLVSTISMPKNLMLHAQLQNKIERGEEDSSPIRTAAVLTCVSGTQPTDAFRPAFCDRSQKIYRARDLNRDRLPLAARTKSIPEIGQFVRFTERPWVGTCFFGFEEPVENMPQYGREYGRVVGEAALLLCSDLTPQEKEPLLIYFVQIGIDLGGMIRAGHPGWTGYGGHGSGRKLPIVFAGMLLGDEELTHINRSFPKASFGEDEQTAYGKCWTGAMVVFAGHSGIDQATGIGRNRGNGWGPYEESPPSTWKDGQITSESYRRCCTSVAWVAQALALRLMHAEKAWDHDAFFDYVDRWMGENDAEAVKQIKAATKRDFSPQWARQGQCWEDFVNEMWAKHRPKLSAPSDGWKQLHDDSYYVNAVEKGRGK